MEEIKNFLESIDNFKNEEMILNLSILFNIICGLASKTMEKLRAQLRKDASWKIKQLYRLRESVVDKSDKFEIGFNIGQILYEEKNYEQALKEFELLKKYSTNDEREYHTFYWIGNSYFELHNYERAIENFQEAMKFARGEKEKYSLYYWLGLSYQNVENYIESIKFLESAKKLTSTDEERYRTNYWLGVAYYYSENFIKSAMELRLAKKIAFDKNSNFFSRYALANTYKALGGKSSVIEELEEGRNFVETEKDRFFLGYLLGNHYNNLKEYQKAIKELEEIKELDCEEVDRYKIFYILGTANHELKEYDKAIQYLSLSMKYPQTDGDRYLSTYWWGMSYFERGNYEEAISKLKETFNYNPNEEAQYYSSYWLGIAYRKNREYEKAIEFLKKSTELTEYAIHGYFSHMGLGKCYREIGDYEEAIKYFKIAQDIEFKRKESCDMFIELGKTYYEMGDWNNSIKYFKSASREAEREENYSNYCKANYWLGLSYYKNGEDSEAVLSLNEATGIKDRYSLYFYRGMALKNLGHIDGALESFEIALKSSNKDIKNCYYEIGKMYCEEKELEKALDYLLKAIKNMKEETTPKDKFFPCSYLLGKVYYKLGELSLAEKTFKKIEEYEGEKELLNIYLGKLYMENTEYNKARKTFQKSYEVEENSIGKYYSSYFIGVLDFQEGEYEKAVENFNTAIEIWNEIGQECEEEESFSYITPSEIYRYLAKAYTELKNPQKILELVKNLKDMEEEKERSDEENCIYWNTIGELYLQADCLEEALENFEVALNYAFTPKENQPIYINIGRCYLKLENYKLAMKNFKSALRVAQTLEEKIYPTYLLVETNFQKEDFDEIIPTLLPLLEELDKKKLSEKAKERVLNHFDSRLYFNINCLLGKIYGMLEEYDKSLEFLERVRRKSVGEIEGCELNYWLGRAYFESKSQRKGIRFLTYAYELLKKLPPEKRVYNFEITYALGVTYYKVREYEEAMKFLDESRQNSTDEGEIYVIDYCVAMCYYENKNYEATLNTLYPLKDISHKNQELVYYFMAISCYYLDEIERGIQYIERAIEFDGENEDYQKVKATLKQKENNPPKN